jgi:hypothetical protein
MALNLSDEVTQKKYIIKNALVPFDASLFELLIILLDWHIY